MEYDFLVYQTALSKIFSLKCTAGLRLMEMFPDISEIFRLDREELESVVGKADWCVNGILNPATLRWAAGEVDWALGSGIRLLPIGDPSYPRRLRECPDAPLLLYCSGNADLNAERVVSVVGTRRATYYGRETCRKMVERLSENPVKPLIVSGLALGIDGTAHLAALDSGLPTVAVLPCGLDEIYPQRHRELALRIMEHGALVTDFARATAPVSLTFVRRNRIIAGMADAVLLAESYVPGGGLITASLARSYDREVFAVPGRLSDASFKGCNQMIAKNVATIADSVDSIEASMGWRAAELRRSERTLFRAEDTPLSRSIMMALSDKSPMSVDELSLVVHAEIGELSSALLELEIEGRIRSTRDGGYDLR